MSSQILTGNDALAEGLRQINPDVVAAYPITPTSHIVERFAEYVAEGKVETEFVPCESEHSAMSACLGAAAAGTRAVTASASQGLALMHEVLFNVSGLRLPVVLLAGNRALSAPLSIHGDHSDVLAQRDTGWLQLFAATPQEAYDLLLQTFRVGEDARVRLPVMLCFDAFDVSHLVTKVEFLDDAIVTKWLGETPQHSPLFDFAHPVSYGTYTNPDYYFEMRRAQHAGMQAAAGVLQEVGKEFGALTGRDYSAPFETYELEDAERAIVILGASAGSVRAAVDTLRAAGEKVGYLRLRTFRPFPTEQIVNALKHVPKIAMCDRTLPSGAPGGPAFCELAAAFAAQKTAPAPQLANFIYGLGQREFGARHAAEVFAALGNEKLETVNFVNLRG